ncbi:MAG: HAMP domain-containing histidine kinase [Polyangiaceae bacterium]|nr:HAMP domain-containing histidine kinase [Polyangiaceae bacterium]
MGYRRIVLLLLYLGIIPGVLLSAIGVFLLILGEALNLLAGILVLTFTGTLVTGVILVWAFVRRERNLSELQADFVSKVSHELRTPLTSIRMFTETLKMRRGETVTEDRCIEALDRESARLQALIDRLLDWGRMESGRRTFELAAHEVSDIIAEAIGAFEPTRTERDVKLRVDVPAGLPKLVCDRPAVVDALVNLLSNAYKYGGSPREIDVRARADEGKLRIDVRDNGAGIERREHKRIFLKFYRVDDKLTRKQDGSGLGLAIVQYVMRAHSGKVEVLSAPGQGSTFTLVLPLKRPVTDALLPDGPHALSAKGGA